MGLVEHTKGTAVRSIVQRCGGWALAWLALTMLAGCNRNPYAAPGGYWGAPYAAQYPGAVPGMLAGTPQAQIAELERRVQQLDMDNRQLTTQLAQSQQKWQVADQRANLFQQQLQDATTQLQQARLAQQDLQGQARGLQASISARGGATLRPNTSAPAGTLPGLTAPPTSSGATNGFSTGLTTQPSQLGNLTSASNSMLQLSNIQVPGASVQMDGQAVRIRVPADQLFAPGTTQLNPASYQILDRVADAVFRYFPKQRVAVEAHTDLGNAGGSAAAAQYQLATSQAQAVMDQLVRRNGLPPRQLAIVAHGPNFPMGDNQTPAGRALNRRIEMVIYPELY